MLAWSEHTYFINWFCAIFRQKEANPMGHFSQYMVESMFFHNMSPRKGGVCGNISKNSKVEAQWHFRLQSGTEQLVALLFMLWVSTVKGREQRA